MADNFDTPYLYLLIRNDLPSLNPGKAVAHGAHAANMFADQIVHEMYAGHHDSYNRWVAESNLGFGTTIALSANRQQIESAVMIADAMGFPAGKAIDTSYPYETTAEIAKLIVHPEAYPPVLRGDKAICFRVEWAAAFVFGNKLDLQPILQHFPLMA